MHTRPKTYHPLAALVLLLASIHSPALAAEYQVIDLGTLGGGASAANALNDHAQVVGWALDADGRTNAFFWEHGVMVSLGFLPVGSHAIAMDINLHGEITGRASVSPTNFHAFQYSNGIMTSIGTLGGPNSIGRGINSAGDITGSSRQTNNTHNHTFVWRDGQLIHVTPYQNVFSCDAYDINADGIVCGITFLWATNDRWWGYVWNDDNENGIHDSGEMRVLGALGTYLSWGSMSGAHAINDSGQVVGWTGITNTVYPRHAFLVTPSNGVWKIPAGSPNPTNHLMQGLGVLGGPTNNSWAYGINNRTWIVGTADMPGGPNQAFLWRNGDMLNLNDLIDPDSDWVLTHALDINDSNEIAGHGLYNGQPRGFVLRASTGLSLVGTNGAPVVDSEPPSLAKGTDFGPVLISQSRTNTFTLRNLGSSNLHVHGWTTNGANDGCFAFAGIPDTVESGGSSNFTVVFSPPTAGLYQATLSLDSDSPTPLTNLLFAGTGARHAQAIDFPPIADPFITNVVTLSATADSGLAVGFEVVLGPAQLTNENQLVFSSTGRVAIAASQPGDANWEPAPVVTHLLEVWGLYDLAIVSAHGDATPPAGVHTFLLDTVVSNSIAVPDPAGGTQLVCLGWALTGHDPDEGIATEFTMTVTNHAVLTWRWSTNFWLETAAGPHGSVLPDSSWQPAHQPTVLTAIPDLYYHFRRWTNSASGTNNFLALIMDVPKSARAIFAENLAIHDTPEWWLAEHGWTNDFDAAALADVDEDRYPAWQEYVADTDPNDSNSYPRITSIHVEDDQPPVVAWPASPNRVYQIHWANGEPTEAWITQQLFRGAAIWTDTNEPPAMRIYRIAPLRPIPDT